MLVGEYGGNPMVPPYRDDESAVRFLARYESKTTPAPRQMHRGNNICFRSPAGDETSPSVHDVSEDDVR
jgi:hypothetical protein